MLSRCDMLELWLLPQLLDNKPNAVLQQDRAPPHILHSVTTLLNTYLTGQRIGRTGPTA
jgi:hypothetical protein